MFNRLAGLLSRIRPRSKTLTEDERLSKEEARLDAIRERQEQKNSRHDWRKIGPGGGGGGST
jgi:hypothetical protein